MPEAEALTETFRVEIANLSEEGRDDVLEALDANPEMSQDDADALIGRTEKADEDREDFEALQKEQDEAMKDGDWATAHDRAEAAEYEMREVEDLGGDADSEIHEAETDQHEIDEAVDQHDMAHQAAVDSADYAAHGMDGAAEVYGETATDHAVASADSAAAAAPNATNPDHDVDGDGVTDA